MLTDEELRKFLQAVDALEPTARSPLRHLIMPEVFRLLYGCGFRVREVLKLRVRDVDLNQGIITVHQGKFRKDRLVPPALPLVNRLRNYAAHFENRPPDAIFFPAPSGRPFSLRTVYTLLRQLLLQCGIPHAGRGKGPRIHDYRHLFAVHTLRRWYRDGEDLEIGRNGVRAQLEQLAASRVALERAVAEADARAYHESAGVGTTIVRSERDGSLVAAQLAAPAGKNRVRPRRSRLPQRN
ncbi:MAG TPA: tyrosine-type recombinase/integrase [Candidatus Polarisedimenticolia bacterium]|nr:tyrosine-type recombinase/integrase [Candidatus Polarisedimenticolia bacterium]